MSRELIRGVRAKHDSWLKSKTQYLGSADAPDAVWNKLNLYMKKKGLLEDKPLTEPMRWGSLLEPSIGSRAVEVLRDQGKTTELVDLDTCFQHDSKPYLVATPDFGVKINGELGLLECKLVTSWGSRHWSDGISDRAHVQVHHQLEVCDFAGFVVVAALFVPEFELQTYIVERNGEIASQLLSHEEAVWNCIQSDTLPEIHNPTTDQVKALFPLAQDSLVTLGEECVPLLEELRLHAERAKHHAAEEDRLKAELQLRLGSNSKGICGDTIISWSNVSTARFDSRAFRDAHPDLNAQFTRQTTHRRFSIKQTKGLDHE